MPDEKHDREKGHAVRDLARARWSLLLIFGIGGVGVVLAVIWATRGIPKEGLLNPYVVGMGKGGYQGAVIPPGRCAKFGDRCEHSPGKLGTCIQREGCTGAGCLFCQSQH